MNIWGYLSTNLLFVVFREGQHCGDMEHDFVPLVHRVNGMATGHITCKQIQWQ